MVKIAEREIRASNRHAGLDPGGFEHLQAIDPAFLPAKDRGGEVRPNESVQRASDQ